MTDPKQQAEQPQGPVEETLARVTPGPSVSPTGESIRAMNERYASLIHAIDETGQDPDEASSRA